MDSRSGQIPGQRVISIAVNIHRTLPYCRGSKPEGRKETLSIRKVTPWFGAFYRVQPRPLFTNKCEFCGDQTSCENQIGGRKM